MKKPRISSLPVGPRPKAGRRCRSKLISVVSCTATTLRPLHAAAVRATWGVSSAVGSTSSDDRRRCAAISPERVPPNALSTSDPLATIRSSIHSARSSRRTSPRTDLVRAIATLRESIAMKALNHVRTSDGIDLCEYRRCLGRGSKADAAEARQLQGGAPQIEPSDQAQQIDLHPFDPADRDAEETVDGQLDPCATWRQAEDAPVDAPVLADGGRRQRNARLGNGAKDVGGKRVGVGAGPYRIIAVVAVGVARDGSADLGDQRLGGGPLDGPDQDGAVAVPARVGCPVVDLDRRTPGDFVVTGIG